MDKEYIIDLVTFYTYFPEERSALEARQMFPKLWADRRELVVTWMAKKGIIWE